MKIVAHILCLICLAGGSPILPVIKLLKQYHKVQIKTEIQAAAFLGRILFEIYGSFVDIGLEQMDSDREASKDRIYELVIFEGVNKSKLSGVLDAFKSWSGNESFDGLLKSKAFISTKDNQNILDAIKDPYILKKLIFLEVDGPSGLSPLFEIAINSFFFFTMTLGDRLCYNHLSEAYLKALYLVVILPSLEGIISKESFLEFLESSDSWGKFKFEGDERIAARIVAHVINHSNEELSTKIMLSPVLKYFLREEVDLHTTFYSILSGEYKKIYNFTNLVSLEGLIKSNVYFGIYYKTEITSLIGYDGTSISVHDCHVAIQGTKPIIYFNGQYLKEHRLKLESEMENCLLVIPHWWSGDEQGCIETINNLFGHDQLKHFVLIMYWASFIKVSKNDLQLMKKPRQSAMKYPLNAPSGLKKLNEIVNLGIFLYHEYSEEFIACDSELTEPKLERREISFPTNLREVLDDSVFPGRSLSESIRSFVSDRSRLFNLMVTRMPKAIIGINWKLFNAIDVFLMLCMVRKKAKFNSAQTYFRILRLISNPGFEVLLGDEVNIFLTNEEFWPRPLEVVASYVEIDEEDERLIELGTHPILQQIQGYLFKILNIGQSKFLVKEKWIYSEKLIERLAQLINGKEKDDAVEFLVNKKFIIEKFVNEESESLFNSQLLPELVPFSPFHCHETGKSCPF